MSLRHPILGGLCCMLFPLSGMAQAFIDASDRLPTDATSFQTKDVWVEDVDEDGDADIILANEFQLNVMLLNDGAGYFTLADYGLLPNSEHDSESIVMADFNMDGHQDLIFVSEDDFEHEYYWRLGSDTFALAPYFLPFTVCRGIAVGDVNNDAFPDAVLGNNGQNMLLLNDGNGQLQNQFFDWLPFINDLTQDVVLEDFDGDNDLDLFVANEDINFLHVNNGSGIFTDETQFRLPQGLNIDTRRVILEDVDSDGDMDLYLCNVAFTVGKDPRNRLFLNNGFGVFTDVSDTHLPGYNDQSLDAEFLDIDQDGFRDLVVSNVLGVPMYCYKNNGQGVFFDVTASYLGNYTIEGFGIASADFNNDGFTDLYICNAEGKDVLLLADPLFLSTDAELIAPQLAIYPNPAKGCFRSTLIVERSMMSFFFSLMVRVLSRKN